MACFYSNAPSTLHAILHVPLRHVSHIHTHIPDLHCLVEALILRLTVSLVTNDSVANRSQVVEYDDEEGILTLFEPSTLALADNGVPQC